MELNCPSCNEAVLITDEDMTATVECPFCQQRFEFDEAEPPPVNESSPPIIQPEPLTSERSLLEWGSVRVTDKRVIIGARTYACRQIASVGITTDFKGPKLLFGKPACCCRIFVLGSYCGCYSAGRSYWFIFGVVNCHFGWSMHACSNYHHTNVLSSWG